MTEDARDFFATIYACDDEVLNEIILNSTNRERYGPDMSTPSTPGDILSPIYKTPNCLELTFTHEFRSRSHRGLVFGSGSCCDIQFPKSRGVARHHFEITFDSSYRLIVKDLGSRLGTCVTYERLDAQEREMQSAMEQDGHPVLRGQSRGMIMPTQRAADGNHRFRHNFTWVIGGNSFLNTQNMYSIVSFGNISVCVQPAYHDIYSEAYKTKVKKFLNLGAYPMSPWLCSFIRSRALAPKPLSEDSNQNNSLLIKTPSEHDKTWKTTHRWDFTSGEIHPVDWNMFGQTGQELRKRQALDEPKDESPQKRLRLEPMLAEDVMRPETRQLHSDGGLVYEIINGERRLKIRAGALSDLENSSQSTRRGKPNAGPPINWKKQWFRKK